MTYTEIKEKNGTNYYYRVRTIREREKFRKKRVYLGKDLSKVEIVLREKRADEELNPKERTIKREINRLIPQIKNILKKNRIKRAGIFGSFASGEYGENSDIDILIEPPKNMGFGFAGLEIQLAQALKKKVDLVSYNGISPYLKEKILNQEIRIL